MHMPLLRSSLRRISARAARPLPAPILGLALILATALTPAPAPAQDPAAGRLYEEARRLARGGDLESALKEYQLLDRQFPKDRLAASSLLAIAEIQRTLGDDRSAGLTLDKLLTDHPRTTEAASAFVMQGEMTVEKARSRDELNQALTSYKRVPLLFSPDAYPDLPARAEALVRHGEISLLLGDRTSALADFVAVAEDESDNAEMWRGRLLLGRTLLESGQTPAALETLQRLIDQGEAAPETERAAARRLVSLAHRLLLRLESGEAPWQKVEKYAPNGLTLGEPIGVAASSDGQVLVVDDDTDKVTRIDTLSGRWESQALSDAVRPAWDDNVAFVVTEERLALPFDGQSVRFLEPKAGRERPLRKMRSAVRGPFGDWFITARGWKGILDYQTPRKGQELLGVLRSEFADLECDPVGRVYALDRKEKRVLRLAVDRRSHETVVTGSWRRAEALALDGLGHVYVLDRGERQIHVYDQEGRRKAVVGPNLPGGLELRQPLDVSVDGSGRLWIADADLPYLVSLQ